MATLNWPGSKPPPPPPLVKGSLLAMAWKPKLDSTTGRVFYYNSRTKTSVWTLPPSVLEEMSKVKCYKCNRDVERVSLCPVCLIDPAPASPPTTPRTIVPPPDPAPKVPTAPLKPAPRRITGTSMSTFLQPRSALESSSTITTTNTNSAAATPSQMQPSLETKSLSPEQMSSPVDPPLTSEQESSIHSESLTPANNPILAETKSVETADSAANVNESLAVNVISPTSETSNEDPKAGPEGGECSSSSETQERQQVADSSLPLGWIAIQDKSSDSLYYFNSQTQEVTWSRPELERTVVQEDLPTGWIAIKDASSSATYYYNQNTQEVTWKKPEMESPRPSIDEVLSGPASTLIPAAAAPILKIRPAALLMAKNALLEMKARDSAHMQGLSAEDAHFINDVLRPKYGDGQLLKDPALVDTLFVHMINHESLRKVIFCEFFLSCFRHELILQLMLKKSSWKIWLLALISESSFGKEGAMLDYVLMTLVEMFAYFFHRYSEKEATILGTTDFCLGISSISSPGKSIVMYDFLVDSALVIIREASMDVCLRVFSGMLTKIASWGAMKPPWATPNFLMPQWQNLFSSLEALEECMFFTLPSKEFYMPDGPLFPGMGVVEAIITLLEKLKVRELEQGVETDPAIMKLQKLYAARGVQELEFFRGVRDFFLFYSDLGCMEKQKMGFEIKAKPPPRCSQSEFCHLLLARKRICYGTKNQVQKKVAAYIAKVSELYARVFAGEIQLAPHLLKDRRSISPSRSSLQRENSFEPVTRTNSGRRDTLNNTPTTTSRRQTVENSNSAYSARTLPSVAFTRQTSSPGRKFSLDIPQRSSSTNHL